MIFQLYSQSDSSRYYQWAIKPLYGKFADQVVAVAECVSLQSVEFKCRVAVGKIKAVWGVTDILDTLDLPTLSDLKMGRTFELGAADELWIDHDGFIKGARTVCRTASRLILTASDIYAKGLT